MLKRKLLLASALAGAELVATSWDAQAGGRAGMSGSRSFHVGTVNCHTNIGGNTGNLHVYSPTNISNVNVNRSLNVFSPTNITNNVNNSTNLNVTNNINNSRYINNSTNVAINSSINIRTTNIFNGVSSGGGHMGGMGGGNNNNNNNSNSNSNSNQNSNANSNTNQNSNSNHNTNTNTVNNSNSIDASGAVNSFFSGLRGLEN